MTTSELLDAMEDAIARLQSHVHENEGRGLYPPSHTGPYTTFDIRDSATVDTVHWTFSVAKSGSSNSAHELRVQMDLAGLSKNAFAGIFDVPAASVQDWLSGTRPVPPWVPRAIRVFELLHPDDRGRLLQRPRTRVGARSRNEHPFSRIEEL